MKLAVSDWYPYRHQATALTQLVPTLSFERVALDTLSGPLHDPAVGPFIVVIDDVGGLPLLGLPSIVEALARKYPALNLFPREPIATARVRALATMIEERFTRYCVSDIAGHKAFGRDVWTKDSPASTRVFDTPPALTAVEMQQAGATSRFLVGEHPTLADALLAALWWTAEDQGRTGDFATYTWLQGWRQRNCAGVPFRK